MVMSGDLVKGLFWDCRVMFYRGDLGKGLHRDYRVHGWGYAWLCDSLLKQTRHYCRSQTL